MAVPQAFPAQTTNTFSPARAGTKGTLIAVVLDASGSMSSCRDATIAGFNEFVLGQAADSSSGEAYLTLVQFDAPNINTVMENINVRDNPQLNHNNYRPGGGTNLLDAIGHTMQRVNGLLQSLEQDQRPGVLIVIITDGAENSSRSFSSADIKQMVSSAETDGDWTFTFLGANVDAFAVGAQFGMNAANTANYTTSSMASTMDVLSESTRTLRKSKSAGVSTAELYASQSFYSDVSRDRMSGKP